MNDTSIKQTIVNASSEDSWPEPDMRLVDGYKIEAARFPLEVFGDDWADWISKTAKGAGSPVDYVAAGLIGGSSVLIGSSCLASPWKSWKEPAILWSCLVGNPSSGKTPGLSSPLDLLKKLDGEINAGFDEEIDEYDRRLQEAKIATDLWKADVKIALKKGVPSPPKPEKAHEPEPPIRRRLIANDATVEIIAPIVQKNPKGILYFRDELAGWLEGMNQYKGKGGGDRAFWLEAYNGNSFTVDRVKFGVNKPIHVPSLFVPVIGGIQPQRLNRALLNDTDDGLSARFLYLWPNAEPPVTPQVFADDDLALDALRKLQRLSIEIDEYDQPVPTIIPLSESALPHFEEFRKDVFQSEKAASGLYLSYMGKNPGRVLRLALNLEMLWYAASNQEQHPKTISERAILCAQGLVTDYFDPMALRAFANAALPLEVCNAMTIAKWIIDIKPEIVNSREILRTSFPGIDCAEDVQDALDELQGAGWIVRDPDGQNTGGRPRNDWLVNPKLRAKLL